MATLNMLNCNIVGANTGIPACAFDPKNVIGAFLVPAAYALTPANLALLQTKLQADVQASPSTSRIYPIWGFEALSDQSEKLVTQKMGYGNSRVVREGKYNLTFTRKRGGLPVQSKLRAFNQNNWKVLFVDSDYFIFGTKDLNGNLTGASLDYFYAHPFTFSDGAKITEYMVEFALSDPKELNDKGQIGYAQCGFDVTQIGGLLDVNLVAKTVTPAPVAGTYEIGALIDDNGTDLYPTYSTALAAGALWTMVNSATGATIAISTVVADGVNGCWKVSQTAADPNLPIVGGNITIGLTNPTALAAAQIVGFEGIPLTIART